MSDKLSTKEWSILVVLMIIIWLIVKQWRKKNYKSFQFCTIVGTWLCPIFVLHPVIVTDRFVRIWTIFTISSFIVWLKVTNFSLEISRKTPRFIYTWFQFLYNVSYLTVIFGLLVFLYAFFMTRSLEYKALFEFIICLIGYGLYFGVLSRDVGQYCTQLMALKIGYFTESGLPTKHLEEDVCSVCGNHTDSEIEKLDEKSIFCTKRKSNEKTYRLKCGHIFHEFCIRGWMIDGKLQTCPYCKDKIGLQEMLQNPYLKSRCFYEKLLNIMRFFACWYTILGRLIAIAFFAMSTWTSPVVVYSGNQGLPEQYKMEMADYWEPPSPKYTFVVTPILPYPADLPPIPHGNSLGTARRRGRPVSWKRSYDVFFVK